MAGGGEWNGSLETIAPAFGSSTEKLGGAEPEPKSRRIKPIWVCGGVILAVVIAGAVVGALFAKNVIHLGSTSGTGSASDASTTNAPGSEATAGSVSGSSQPSATTGSSSPQPTSCSTPGSIPSADKGTFMDPTSWLDMIDFNCTFTDVMVGGLPIVGLNSTWDDSAQANPNVPPLNESWGSYGSLPIRGVNLGGWLSLEPFITPSLFDFDSSLGIVDEFSLCAYLGPKDAASTLEKHYSTFITEQDFKSIADAGLDHVRIPYSYWAVKTYDDDPYVLGVSWRYLLRGIEWARRYGLRVNLDLHGVPGSQNGWNHSGRQGSIDWLVGPNGTTNAQRSLEIHDQLSKFFAQERYRNVVAFYGLVNEPALSIPQGDLITWTTEAYNTVRGNGVNATQVFSDALEGLPAWAGKLTGYGDSLVIDSYEYTVFDNYLIGLEHADKISFACQTYAGQLDTSMDVSTGFGPTLLGEWSQADTDCSLYLNGMGNGARWNGSFSGTIGQPRCPTLDSRCDCGAANADPSTFTDDFKLFLQTWAEAQMSAFEHSWGWFYWTWKTEAAPLWSYQAGLQGDFMPPVAYQRSWDCSKSTPGFGDLPEYY